MLFSSYLRGLLCLCETRGKTLHGFFCFNESSNAFHDDENHDFARKISLLHE